MIRVFNNFKLKYSPPPPPNTADLGTDEKAAVFGIALGVIYNLQNPYLGLGNVWRYWGEAVLGGAVLGPGTTAI